MSDISFIVVSIPEEKIEGEDTKTRETNIEYLYGEDLANQIVDALLEKNLIQAGHIDNATYTTKYKWDGRTITRQERALTLKLASERLTDEAKKRITEVIDRCHPYETVSITFGTAHSMTPKYSVWAGGQKGSGDDHPVPVPGG
jgi:uncharacterized protein involved in tolerance to divalent cations